MFLVTSTYTASADEIAAFLAEHRAWLAPLFDSGVFVLSGRLVPFTGGFMVARGIGRAALEATLATDPFRVAGLLTHTIIELEPMRAAPSLAHLLDAAPPEQA